MNNYIIKVYISQRCRLCKETQIDFYDIIVHLLAILKNNRRCMVHVLK